MLTRWLTNLATVEEATSPEQLEAIYRFRYDVYVREFNVSKHPQADHSSNVLRDEDDDSPYARHFFTGTKDDMTSAMRLRAWPAGEVPAEVFDKYSLGVFPGIEGLNVSEVSKMMIQPTLRGKLLYPSLLSAGFEHLAKHHQTDLVFLYCIPGLVRHYVKQGARVYGAQISAIQTMVPLVIVMSDYAHLKKSKSIVAPVVKKYYGPGKNRCIDLGQLEDAFSEAKVPVTFQRSKVREDVTRYMNMMERNPPVFENLSPEAINKLLASGFVLDVSADNIVTNDQIYDREVYMILEGKFEALVNGRFLCSYQPGDVFGAPSFFSEDGLRGASVLARSDGKVLVLRRKFLRELTRRDPKAGFQVLMNLSRILAERLRLEFQRSTLTEKLAAYLMDTTMDGSTNTYNRSFFSERLTDELRRSERYGRVLSLGFVELREIEVVRAEHGNDGCDEVMSELANLMRGVLRNTDLLARFADAQFAIILPETSKDEAAVACGKIVKKVESHTFLCDGNEVAVGIGSSVSSTDELTEVGEIDGLVDAAVERLTES